MSGTDLGRELLEIALPIAGSVVKHLEDALVRADQITTKTTDTDLVTEMDTWAERYITEQILDLRPDDGIQGEEGADVIGTSGIRWCIDPIDGTVNFVHGLPGFCVSIAAQVNGESIAGVVAAPILGDTFSAHRGGGAQLNGMAVRCSDTTDLGRALVATGFGYDPDRRRRQAEVLTRVIPHIADIRRVGAAAMDLCSVACGRVDAYWEVGLNPWDHAAGALIAREAGARCEGLDTIRPSSAFLLAAPEAIWEPLRTLLMEARATEV